MLSDKQVTILLEMSSMVDRGILEGIANFSGAKGNWLITMDSPFYRDMVNPSVVDKIRCSHPTGIIIREPGDNRCQRRQFDEILDLHVPTIVVATTSECAAGDGVIHVDNAEIGRVAAEYLLDKGFCCFGYFGFCSLPWSQQRKESFCRTISERGGKLYDYDRLSNIANLFSKKEEESLVRWLKGLPKPIGIMAYNDKNARHVIEAGKIAQISIPDDVAVIGVGNDKLICEISNPPLSSIALNTGKAGYEAAALLDEFMQKPERQAQRVVITAGAVGVVERFSTDIIAINDDDVKRAVLFIRKNWKKPLQNSDVAQAAAVSIRTLQDKFRDWLGRSIHDEITRTRVAEVAKILRETDMPTTVIVEEMGFGSERNLIRNFEREMKITPGRYRRQFLNG
jgi:LacI family transcriptional regulator